MNARTAIIAVVVAVVLGVVTWVAMRPPARPNAPRAAQGRLAQVGSATSVRVKDETGAEATLVLVGDVGAWVVREGADGPSWPVEPGAAQGLLRLLGEVARASPTAATGAKAGTEVVLSLPAADAVTLRISDQALGGRIRIHEFTADGALEYEAQAGLADLVKPRNVLAWRQADLLGAPGQPTELIITSGGSTLAFKQVRGRWGMVAPVAAPVDAAAMQELLEAKLPPLRFVTAMDAPAQDAVEPFATIRKETRLAPKDGGEAQSFSIEVIVRSQADALGEKFSVDAVGTRRFGPGGGHVEFGPISAVVDRAAVIAIAQPPEHYVSKRSVQAPAADITRVQVVRRNGALSLDEPLAHPESPSQGIILDRTLDGWQRSDEGRASPTRPDAKAILAVLDVLCAQPATRVWMSNPDAGVERIAAIGVSSQSGLLEVVEFGLAAGNGEEVAAAYVRSGNLIRTYTNVDAQHAIAALLALAEAP